MTQEQIVKLLDKQFLKHHRNAKTFREQGDLKSARKELDLEYESIEILMQIHNSTDEEEVERLYIRYNIDGYNED